MITVKCGFVCNQQEGCPLTGAFQSLNYPSPYPNHEDCQWNFNISSGYAVVIKVTDFYTESSYDTLTFYDAPIAISSLQFQRYRAGSSNIIEFHHNLHPKVQI